MGIHLKLRLEPLPPLGRLPVGVGLAGMGVELAQHDPRLDRALPPVHLEAHRGVDRVTLLDAEPGAPEGDPEGPVRSASEAEARVLPLLPHRPHVLDPRRRHQQAHPGIAHPERRQPLELLGEVEAESGAADHRVDLDRPHQVIRPEHGCGVGAERLPEPVDRVGGELEAGGRPVAAERGEVRGAGLEAGQEVEAGDAAPRAAAAALAVERDHDRRPVVALGEA